MTGVFVVNAVLHHVGCEVSVSIPLSRENCYHTYDERNRGRKMSIVQRIRHVSFRLCSLSAILLLFACSSLDIEFTGKHYPTLKEPADLWADVEYQRGAFDPRPEQYRPRTGKIMMSQGYTYIGHISVQVPENRGKELDEIMAREAARIGGHAILLQDYHVEIMHVWYARKGPGVPVSDYLVEYEIGMQRRKYAYSTGTVWRKED